MSATTFIRRFIFSLPKHRIFTTRECLIYGKRSAIDYALHMLVKKEIILRLAYGVFVRNEGVVPEFDPIIVAAVKARAFGKKLIMHGSALAKKLGIESAPNVNNIFAVNGPTSSFRYGKTTIHLEHIGPRQVKLKENKVGQAARLLWYLGKENLHWQIIRSVTAGFLRPDREGLRRSAVLIPAWLAESFMQSAYWLSPH